MQNAPRQPATPKILVSMCVLGHPVRYNGSAKTAAHATLARWQREGRLVSVCPELAGGLSVPRPPAEIANGESGQRVLAGAARIVDVHGTDVTAPFVDGAHTALALARAHDCRFAILADGSPSCGSSFIYDGSFAGRRHAGAGVTAALLRQHGVEVFADTEIDALAARLAQHAQAE
ncbi:protein of unknown function DUF523 [Burkholderia cepacia GG4]|uniref:Purine nucleoside phosphorylase n=2 Tax=Burkholderia cepacia TaxID=292 RepID=A0A9W3PD31_BURCE|nr:DUF523 domain-containing protein [Burkholderia cepacia]AFQ52226.1 protein of unknown function DUF523 [Burkholderia cepacia GG4]